MPNSPKQPLTVAEAAAALGVAERTIRDLIKRGSLPGAYRLDPSARSVWRIPAETVDRIIEQRHQGQEVNR